jgi:hypothetical protein
MPAAVLDASAIGPVDVAVIRFEGSEFSGGDARAEDQQQATAQPAMPPDDGIAKIKELGEMRSQGLLTDEEFTAAKAQILGT